MPGVPRGLAEHCLQVDPKAKPVKEHLRRSAVQKRKAIGEEVARLLAAEFIREIYHSEWLANVVMVPKKDDSLRMCIDFKHINRACPKDHFPLPRIDQIVDSTAGCERLSFLDANSGYHQIRLYGPDEIKTAFITPFRCFCYVTMPFGLKNAGATFMRMIQKCLLTQINWNVEAYRDDIVVKSHKGSDLLTDLAETFANLRRYDIKLNPSKSDAVFAELKSLLSTQPVLAAPISKEPLLLYIAATGQVVSTMLNGSGAGVVLVSPRGDKLSYVLQIHFDSSNNEAGYEALLYGLRMAISLGVRRLMVYGDSDLVVNQVMKEWDVRSPAMTGYCNAVGKLEKRFEGLELHHIPRLKNQAADDLAKIGSKREVVPSNVFLEHIHTPSVQEDPFTEEPP
ncbi:unnamed protein product [Triticum aestivum]|uniref:Uncharacterized protein n=1 Tax=Triticum aestivum TaxID=4565 RepID=A0A7H4LQZ8_WHEAT|nr:unnamed protein product [Triticum aestivum]